VIRQASTVSSQPMRESDTGVSWRVGRRRARRGRRQPSQTMNRQELIDRVALAAELPRPAAARAVDAALEAIEASLRDGEAVRLTGFGTFRVAHHTGRAGVNPRTGERIEVPTTAVPRFTAGVRLKQAVR
jgi:nucleoid DNA-binding protein